MADNLQMKAVSLSRVPKTTPRFRCAWTQYSVQFCSWLRTTEKGYQAQSVRYKKIRCKHLSFVPEVTILHMTCCPPRQLLSAHDPYQEFVAEAADLHLTKSQVPKYSAQIILFAQCRHCKWLRSIWGMVENYWNLCPQMPARTDFVNREPSSKFCYAN